LTSFFRPSREKGGKRGSALLHMSLKVVSKGPGGAASEKKKKRVREGSCGRTPSLITFWGKGRKRNGLGVLALREGKTTRERKRLFSVPPKKGGKAGFF